MKNRRQFVQYELSKFCSLEGIKWFLDPFWFQINKLTNTEASTVLWSVVKHAGSFRNAGENTRRICSK